MADAARQAATRSNLVRLRRQLVQVEKGAALLRRKRESLVTELFKQAKVAIDRRQGIDAHARQASSAMLEALAATGAAGLTAAGWPTRQVEVELKPIDAWGVHAVELETPPVVVRSLASRALPPGPDEAATLAAAEAFERLVELVLAEAPKEHLLRRLGGELNRASRLVNTLEQRVAVDLRRQLTSIRRTLEEREREEHLGLKRLMARRGGR